MAEEKPSVYCSTSGTFFTDKDQLADHYKSDFHRYNLKRKIAGLPPVTKDWFDSRKELLSHSTTGVQAQKIWTDPLTKKRFQSENTYNAFTRSKKYQDLVKRNGGAAPKPFISIKRNDEPDTQARPDTSGAQHPSHTIKAPNRGASHVSQNVEEDADVEESEWETASEDEEVEEDSIPQVDWEVTRSLFDNHISQSFESNLEYMWKNFGFYLPDTEYLEDPEGLLKYLGSKLAEGHIPLYASGMDANVKQFHSLHAVQRHMIDTNQCRMAYDGVEEEYEDFYDYSKALTPEAETSGDIVMSGTEEPVSTISGGYELALPDQEGKASKVIGSREFLRYYRQNHKPSDTRKSVQIATLHQRYRNLGVALIESPGEKQAKRASKQAQKQQKKEDRIRLRTDLNTNVNRNLPRNVTF